MFANGKFIYQNSLGKTIEFSSNSPFKIYSDGVDGLTSHDIDISEVYSQGQVGTSIQSQRITSKSISITGEFSGDVKNNRARLRNIIYPMDKGKFIYQNKDTYLYLDVSPSTTPSISNGETEQQFQFILLAPYPFWKDANGETTVRFGEYHSLYKYPQSFSSTVPWKISEKSINNIINIYNDSQYELGFSVTFICNGNVQDPYIINPNTQEKIVLDTWDFIADDDTTGYCIKVITEENKKAVEVTYPYGEVHSMLNLMTDDSSFFKLHSGDNPIKFGATRGEKFLEVLISFERIEVGI